MPALGSFQLHIFHEHHAERFSNIIARVGGAIPAGQTLGSELGRAVAAVFRRTKPESGYDPAHFRAAVYAMAVSYVPGLIVPVAFVGDALHMEAAKCFADKLGGYGVAFVVVAL